MDAMEIVALTQDAVARLLRERAGLPAHPTNGRRRVPRWPFPGTVELWITNKAGVEEHMLTTSLNLSLGGVGLRCHEELRSGLKVAIAIHEPEISFHGRAVVRHCTKLDDEYYVGMKFLFDVE